MIDHYLKTIQEHEILSRVVKHATTYEPDVLTAGISTNRRYVLDMCYKKYCFEPYQNTSLNSLYNKQNQQLCKLKCYINYLKTLRSEKEKDLSDKNYVGALLRKRQLSLKNVEWEIGRTNNKIKELQSQFNKRQKT